MYKTTKGIAIQIVNEFLVQHSNPSERQFLFTYFIQIHNNLAYPVQLLRRKWIITDGTSQEEIVEGEGVVGLTPIIEPGGQFEYNSFCSLTTPIGKMEGYYFLENKITGEEVIAQIPAFYFTYPPILN